MLDLSNSTPQKLIQPAHIAEITQTNQADTKNQATKTTPATTPLTQANLQNLQQGTFFQPPLNKNNLKSVKSASTTNVLTETNVGELLQNIEDFFSEANQQNSTKISEILRKILDFSSNTAEGPEGFSADATLFNAFSSLVSEAQLQTVLHKIALGLAPIFLIGAIYDLYKDASNAIYLHQRCQALIAQKKEMLKLILNSSVESKTAAETAAKSNIIKKPLNNLSRILENTENTENTTNNINHETNEILKAHIQDLGQQIKILRKHCLTEKLRTAADVGNLIGAFLASMYSIGVILPNGYKGGLDDLAYQTTLAPDPKQIYSDYGDALHDHFSQVNEFSDLISSTANIAVAGSSFFIASQLLTIATGLSDIHTGHLKNKKLKQELNILNQELYQNYLKNIQKKFEKNSHLYLLWQSTFAYQNNPFLENREINIYHDYFTRQQKFEKTKHRTSGIVLATGGTLTLNSSALFLLSVIFYPIGIALFSAGTLANISAVSIKYRAGVQQKKLQGRNQNLDINYTNYYGDLRAKKQRKHISPSFLSDFIFQLKHFSVLHKVLNTASDKKNKENEANKNTIHQEFAKKIIKLRHSFWASQNNTSLLDGGLHLFKFEQVRKSYRYESIDTQFAWFNVLIDELLKIQSFKNPSSKINLNKLKEDVQATYLSLKSEKDLYLIFNTNINLNINLNIDLNINLKLNLISSNDLFQKNIDNITNNSNNAEILNNSEILDAENFIQKSLPKNIKTAIDNIWNELLSITYQEPKALKQLLTCWQKTSISDNQAQKAYYNFNHDFAKILSQVFGTSTPAANTIANKINLTSNQTSNQTLLNPDFNLNFNAMDTHATEIFAAIHSTHRDIYLKVFAACEKVLGLENQYIHMNFAKISDENWHTCLYHPKVQKVLIEILKQQAKFDRKQSIENQFNVLRAFDFLEKI